MNSDRETRKGFQEGLREGIYGAELLGWDVLEEIHLSLETWAPAGEEAHPLDSGSDETNA